MNTTDNYYCLTHVNGDFKVTVEFNSESLCDVIMYLVAFLKGCTFSENSIKEYIEEF